MEGKHSSDDIVICRCEEVTREQVREAIRDGATDIRGVRVRTRAGMGLCQGKQCERLVRSILAAELKRTPADFPPYNTRPPVRALGIGPLTEDANGK